MNNFKYQYNEIDFIFHTFLEVIKELFFISLG